MANAVLEKKTNASANPYDEMPLKRLLIAQSTVQEEMAANKKQLAKIEDAISKRVADSVKAARDELQKFEGTVRATVEGCEVVSNVPKKVEWNTKELDSIASKISEKGYDPTDWIDFKLSIAEAKYKAMPAALRSLCDTARTMKHGKEQLDITPVE